jgi:GTP diphosphokinase / guanosine-3',5'-bis(diphosphate) 3'-diphosphatase
MTLGMLAAAVGRVKNAAAGGSSPACEAERTEISDAQALAALCADLRTEFAVDGVIRYGVAFPARATTLLWSSALHLDIRHCGGRNPVLISERRATLVTEATDGKDPELVIAALLHDAIEDQEVPRSVIAGTFGDGVAELVEEVTDDKKLEKPERKRLQIEHAHKKSQRAKILKLADRTSNLRAIAASPPPEWSVKRRLEYVDWARKVAKGLAGVSKWLEGEFEHAAKEAERSTVFHR